MAKLVCNITGQTLVASKDYYAKKLEHANNDIAALDRTYICRKAKSLIKRGYSVEDIRKMLNINPKTVNDISPEHLTEILEADKSLDVQRILSNFDTVSSLVANNTDPEVKRFIDMLKSN